MPCSGFASRGICVDSGSNHEPSSGKLRWRRRGDPPLSTIHQPRLVRNRDVIRDQSAEAPQSPAGWPPRHYVVDAEATPSRAPVLLRELMTVVVSCAPRCGHSEPNRIIGTIVDPVALLAADEGDRSAQSRRPRSAARPMIEAAAVRQSGRPSPPDQRRQLHCRTSVNGKYTAPAAVAETPCAWIRRETAGKRIAPPGVAAVEK